MFSNKNCQVSKHNAAFRLACRSPHCRLHDEICTTAQTPFDSKTKRYAPLSLLIDNPAALPIAADLRQLKSIQLERS